MTPQSSPHAADLARLRRLSNRMDRAFRLPLVGVRVGWDSIIGLIPGIGDTLALVPGAYIIKEAHRMGVPGHKLLQMGANMGVDFAIGTVPLVGDLFDIGWKSNSRNVDLIHRHFEELQATAPSTRDVEGRLSSHHPTLDG